MVLTQLNKITICINVSLFLKSMQYLYTIQFIKYHNSLAKWNTGLICRIQFVSAGGVQSTIVCSFWYGTTTFDFTYIFPVYLSIDIITIPLYTL